jgi:methylphosphotriester-DNA--protein-cysteine methyltransferase
MSNEATDATLQITGQPRETEVPHAVVGGLPQGKLRRVTAYIDSNLQRELQLAEVTHMSPYHFARLFKTATGVSPHRFVVRRRIECRDRPAHHVHVLHRLDRAGRGVQDRQSFCDHCTAHPGRDTERAPDGEYPDPPPK